MNRVLSQRDFAGKHTSAHARFLLGKYLVRRERGRTVSSMITEVEAYDGPEDTASHAHRGKTKRNAVMFGSPGQWYVYLVYGMHYMVTVVPGPIGYPAAILIRSVDTVSGPGRVARFFHVGGGMNNKPVSRSSGFYILDRGITIPDAYIRRGGRIGVQYASREWSEKPLRFFITRGIDG